MKEKLSILLAIIILAATVSCSEIADETLPETERQSEPVATDSSDESVSETVNPRLLIDDELPDISFGGNDFIILGGSFVEVESITGEVVNDTVYNRNLTLSDRFDVNIKLLDAGSDPNAIFSRSVQAGTEDFHTAMYHVVTMSGLVLRDCFLNWYDLDYIDFEKPWWPDSNIEDLTVNDICYIAVGDAAPSITTFTYAVFYDKYEAEKYADKIGDIYSIVKEGKWTLDKLKTIAEMAYSDKNGNGQMDEDDYYGFTTDRQSNVNAYLWAFGGKIFEKNSNGVMENVYYNDHLVDIFDVIDDLVNNTVGVYSDFEHGVGEVMFLKGQTLFTNSALLFALSLGDYENEYGIVPMPKYDEAQEEYVTMADGAHPGIAIPKTIEDTEFVGVMLEALAAENYKTVMPAYYDVCLKTRYTSSPNDAEMIDLAVDSCVFDFGYIYDNWSGVSFYPQRILERNKNITSYYKISEKIVTRYYNQVLAMFGQE